MDILWRHETHTLKNRNRISLTWESPLELIDDATSLIRLKPPNKRPVCDLTNYVSLRQ